MGLLDNLTSKISSTVSTMQENAAKIAEAQTEEASVEADVDFFMPLDGQVAKVTCDVLNVRPTPSTKENRIGTLKRGDSIGIKAMCDDWLQIDFEGNDAYVFAAYTDYEKPEMTVTASSLNVRKAPGTDSDKVGSLANGTVVKVLGEKSGWAKILYNDRIGYVSKEYLA